MKYRVLTVGLIIAVAIAAATSILWPNYISQQHDPLRHAESHAEVTLEENQHSPKSVSGNLSLSNQIEENRNDIRTRSIVHAADESLIDASLLQTFLSNRLVASYRVVTIDSDSLRQYLRGDTSNDVPQIDLVDGYSVSLETITAEDHTSGWQTGMATWIGKIVGDDFGGATIVIAPDGGLDATITSSKGRYRIEGIGLNPYHVVWRMDTSDPYPID